MTESRSRFALRAHLASSELTGKDDWTLPQSMRQRPKSTRVFTHDLRHTHATLALQAGIHPKIVSERLGHATVSITLDTYSHAIPAMQEEAAALIAGLVFAGE